MKKIFLLSTMIITSFGAMNVQSLSAAPQQAEKTISPAVGRQAKLLVSKINQAVQLQGNQFSTVNKVCIEYFQLLEGAGAKSTDNTPQVSFWKQQRDQKIKALLTPGQLKSWDSFKE